MREQAVVRVSPKAGYVRSVWVQEVQANGWLRGSIEAEDRPGTSSWYAPHHVIWRGPSVVGHDWGGIQPGTLVQLMEGDIGMVVSRKGATLDVNVADKGVMRIDWSRVRPLDDVV